MEAKLRRMVRRAKAAGACEWELDRIRACQTFEKAKKHPDAPYWAYWYVSKVIKLRWEEVEELIAKDADFSYRYARYILKGRFHAGEKVIRRNPCSSNLYTEYITRGDDSWKQDCIE